MADSTDISLISSIADATIQSISGDEPSVDSWNRRIYHLGLTGKFAVRGVTVRSQLADLRMQDPHLILAAGQQLPSFMIFGAQWRHVIELMEHLDTEDLPAALLQLYRHDLYPDRRIRIAAFQNATRALTELAPDVTALLSSLGIETIAATIPVGDLAATRAEALEQYTDLTGSWYEAAQDSEQREALTLGISSNATLPAAEGWVDLQGRFYPAGLPEINEDVVTRAMARRAAVAATYLSLGISEEPRDEADTAPERLDPDKSYWLWITLGPPMSEGLGTDVLPIRPEALTGADKVEVGLFADHGLTLLADPENSSIALSCRIITFESTGVNQFVPVDSGHLRLPSGSMGDRAWIPFQTPGHGGTWYLRCGVFVRGVLVHVETLTVAVDPSRDICEHTTTFRTLNEGEHSQLDLLESPTLTLYANQSPSSIDLSFYAPGTDVGESVVAQASAAHGETLARLRAARAVLSKISYGVERPYSAGDPSSYRLVRNEERNEEHYETSSISLDIRELAQRGRALWESFTAALDKTPNERDALRERMRRPGTVEIALKRNAAHVLPAQVFYDYELDTTVEPTKLSLCKQSEEWLKQPDDAHACVQGGDGCTENDRRRVCLSGFWGLRHGVSTQLSIKTDCDPSPITELARHGQLVLAHAISTEPEIQQAWRRHSCELAKHAQLRDLKIGPDDGSVDWVGAMAAGEPPGALLYFLSHMELRDEGQIVKFNRQSGPSLDNSTITDAKLQLCGSRPLLFLNGCESAGQDPLTLVSLIDNFLGRGASGAIGTETTVFLDTATRFAEAFVAAFNHAPLGEAMRLARWELLRKGSPLGLIYLSFGLVKLHIAKEPTAQSVG